MPVEMSFANGMWMFRGLGSLVVGNWAGRTIKALCVQPRYAPVAAYAFARR